MKIKALKALISPSPWGVGHLAVITSWTGERFLHTAYAVTDEHVVITDAGVFKAEEVVYERRDRSA